MRADGAGDQFAGVRLKEIPALGTLLRPMRAVAIVRLLLCGLRSLSAGRTEKSNRCDADKRSREESTTRDIGHDTLHNSWPFRSFYRRGAIELSPEGTLALIN